ncbi:NAD-binding protein [[Mycobacterium] nativiensis]|uniref:NAD-binding protein n=1 Tax=[Mycobacterium] nativiensis TaxID=2855503 RepID=A0ABU5XQI6_9MYCO|nr:NAD-binding protein [Mycolicibacter sp. MYC340]MEB3030242.1 NAD-binding protein [Mycolicibacter sp. MYC340]
MPNPLQLFAFWTRRSIKPRPRPIRVPTTDQTTEVIFLFMRRMRAPFIVVIANFSICTTGLMLMPGVDAQGNPYRLTVFDAFYQMTITLTTVGYSEVPHAFSYPQRMWLSLSIYLVVISWAFAIGVFFSVLNDTAFQDAIAAQRFRRQVRRMVEPFVIIAGYGQAGRAVGAELDEHGRRFVVIDKQESRIAAVVTEQLSSDVPAIEGDCAIPPLLGVAGLAHRDCEGVLALTDDDDANLAVVMAVALLRPEVPVFARCSDPTIQARIERFSPAGIINPGDRFGEYLALSIHRPINHQLLRWLMDNDEDQLPPLRRGLAAGRWVVCADPEFGDELVRDLSASGLTVDLADAADDDLDIADAIGFIAGTGSDTTNIAIAEQARLANPDVYLVVRQQTDTKKALLDALQIDSVYIATELVAREVLARTLTPVFWSFVEHTFGRDEAWATEVRDHLQACCGRRTPQRGVITLSPEQSPAIADWLRRGETLTLADLIRRPDDREVALPLAALVLLRDGVPTFMPAAETTLALGDQVLLVGKSDGLSQVREICHYPSTVEYLATGRDVPLTWVWAKLTARSRRAVAAQTD